MKFTPKKSPGFSSEAAATPTSEVSKTSSAKASPTKVVSQRNAAERLAFCQGQVNERNLWISENWVVSFNDALLVWFYKVHQGVIKDRHSEKLCF